jgi:hypothetical protein
MSMAALKVFPSNRRIHVPREWLDALGARPHISQADVIAVGRVKAELRASLGHTSHADWITADLRLRRGQQSSPDQALIDAGVISLTDPGVYAYLGYVKDGAVIRVYPDGTCTVVAHFRREWRGVGLVVEREGPE